MKNPMKLLQFTGICYSIFKDDASNKRNVTEKKLSPYKTHCLLHVLTIFTMSKISKNSRSREMA